MASFVELNNDQRRETVNTRQRYQTWRAAIEREYGYRGSMVWEETGGRRYLMRSSYDQHGIRRLRSLGAESPETVSTKQRFDEERLAATESRRKIDEVVERQAAINRALNLGRVPILTARILRLLDHRGLLGKGIRVVGTNALYVYEAGCGVFLDPSITATDDVDLLFDARKRLHLVGDPDLPDDTLIQLLKRADRSFAKARQSFRAQNDDGFLVDLIKPIPNPPWRKGPMRLGSSDDLDASEIEGLVWLENAPPFEQTCIDDQGFPLRIVTADPRAFAIHKYWISMRAEQSPVKKTRDAEQARVVAALVRSYLQHLPFDAAELRMFPKDVCDAGLAALAPTEQGSA
jgi:hypothetical protein